MLEFHANRTPNEFDLIRFFGKDFKVLIKAPIEEKRRKFDIYEDVIRKTIKVEAKLSL